MWLCGYAVLIVVSGTILGQSPGTSPSPTFDSAVVQASAPGITPVMTGGVLRGGRYELHNATMLDMIRTAWGIDADKVIGGPNWLENDRFDVVASTAPATSQDTALLMLQALLADRFRLVVHSDRKPFPAFALTVGKHPRLKKAEGTGDTGCRLRQQSMSLAGHIQNAVTVCQNLTMSAFAARIPSIAGTYIEHPVIDQTGLTGMWDFNITWTARQLLGLAGADGITFSDALGKQLGLQLEPKNVPMPVVVVDSVNREPAGNLPGRTQNTPAAPMEFEVADIKPSEPGTPERALFLPGGRIDYRAITLKELIQYGWNIKGDDMLVGAPDWLGDDRFSVLAKAPSTSQAAAGAKGPPIDLDALRFMFRALLADRFKLTVHHEERAVSVYAVVAVKPKLKQADPSNRAGCKQATGNAGTGARIISTFSYTCLNTTMAQFAKQLERGSMGDLPHPVFDSTGLEGAWDFALTWTPQVLAKAADVAPAAGAAASDPMGGLTLSEALEKQLGLRLEIEKRPVSVLVIDHIERKPTDN